MITKMAESPSSSAANPAFQLPTTTTLVQPATSTAATIKREGSPKSPTQDSLSKKRARNRHVPYQNTKSPSGSCSSSSSDEGSGEIDVGDIGTLMEVRNKRIQANSRERKRMHTVNSAFDQLRELVPTYPSNRKLSKIDTLRLACTYIQDLVSVLHQTRAMQSMQGDEMVQFPVYAESYGMPGPYSPCFSVKTEAAISEFPAFTNYRMPSTCMTPVSLPVISKPQAIVMYLVTQLYSTRLLFNTALFCNPQTCESDYSTSETETHSPPYLPSTSHSTLPGIGVRPPPLSRTCSDSAAPIHRPMAHATVSVTGGSPHSQPQRQMTIPSPLATHAVQHTAPPLVSSELAIQHSPPVWQRSGSMPTYPVYGQ